MDFDTEVKLAVYQHFAKNGRPPTAEQVAEVTGSQVGDVLDAYGRLRAQRVLVLDANGRSIRMAPPFSGVPTQHIVLAGGKQYYANCAWDSLGVLAALHLPGEVRSRCEQSGEPFLLHVDLNGPEASTWLFHCLVPATKWWDNIVFT